MLTSVGLCVIPTWIVVHKHEPGELNGKTSHYEPEVDSTSGEEVIVNPEAKSTHAAELSKSAQLEGR